MTDTISLVLGTVGLALIITVVGALLDKRAQRRREKGILR